MPQVLRCVILSLFWLMTSATRVKSAEPVALPGGTFTMGTNDGEDDEQPPHQVTVVPFAVSPYEVTEAQYDSCTASGKCTPPHYEDGTCRIWSGENFRKVRIPSSARHPDFPVVCVTWHQAQQFCRYRGMQLPTEAQWEFAARGATVTRYPWGDRQSSPGQAVLSRNNGPLRVGACPPNAWGLFDMTGNVWEWVRDVYAPDTYKSDATVATAGFYRIIRGGGWYSNPAQATVTNREWFSPDYGEASIGFRCVAPR